MSIVENCVASFKEFDISVSRWELLDHGVTALSGPSGSGKTTVLRLLLGLIPCPNLKWTFGDLDIARLPVEERRLGVVFQNLELFPHMTARQNVWFAARARRLPEAEVNKDYGRLISELRLQHCDDRSVLDLSGGERQRVALARALIGRPRFLFLDEPFSSLDTQLRAEARELVKSAIADANIPTLLITHDAEDLRVLANRVDFIESGRLR